MRPYLQAMETTAREMEAMTVSARSLLVDMHDFFCLCALRLMIHQLR
jgi:hypothetical protein